MPSSSASKKSSSRRTAMRDIAVKKNRLEETFTVHRIQPKQQINEQQSSKASSFRDDDLPKIEPLRDQDQQNSQQAQQELEAAMDEVLASDDLMQQAEQQEAELEDVKPVDVEPKDFVRVKFSKFVQLVANHDFEEVMKTNLEEEVVLSSNLLTELAGAHDQREERKVPIIFLVGLAIGVVLTYILLNK